MFLIINTIWNIIFESKNSYLFFLEYPVACYVGSNSFKIRACSVKLTIPLYFAKNAAALVVLTATIWVHVPIFFKISWVRRKFFSTAKYRHFYLFHRFDHFYRKWRYWI